MVTESLDEFIESVRADVPNEPFFNRARWAEDGCEGCGEYTGCVAMSEDYERLLREHTTMLAIIEAARRRGRYLDDAYEDATEGS